MTEHPGFAPFSVYEIPTRIQCCLGCRALIDEDEYRPDRERESELHAQVCPWTLSQRLDLVIRLLHAHGLSHLDRDTMLIDLEGDLLSKWDDMVTERFPEAPPLEEQ